MISSLLKRAAKLYELWRSIDSGTGVRAPICSPEFVLCLLKWYMKGKSENSTDSNCPSHLSWACSRLLWWGSLNSLSLWLYLERYWLTSSYLTFPFLFLIKFHFKKKKRKKREPYLCVTYIEWQKRKRKYIRYS